MEVERAEVNGCGALFFPARGRDANQSVGLLLAGLRSSTLLHRFSDWTEAWQTAGFAIASYDFKDDRYTWGADAGVATISELLAEARRRWPVRRPVVCGSSRGGLTTLVWAHRNPGVPRGLVRDEPGDEPGTVLRAGGPSRVTQCGAWNSEQGRTP